MANVAYTQEFQGKFEQFLATYQLKAQEPLDPNKVKEFLEKELTAKRDRFIQEAFSQLSVVQILDALDFLAAEYPIDNGSQLESSTVFPVGSLSQALTEPITSLPIDADPTSVVAEKLSDGLQIVNYKSKKKGRK